MEPARKTHLTHAITTRLTRIKEPRPRPREKVRSDPALQCLLPGTDSGASGSGGPDRGAFFSTGDLVAEPGVELDSAERRGRLLKDRLCDGNRADAFPWIGSVRGFEPERQMGPGVPTIPGAGAGGIYAGGGRFGLRTFPSGPGFSSRGEVGIAGVGGNASGLAWSLYLDRAAASVARTRVCAGNRRSGPALVEWTAAAFGTGN